MPALHVVGEIMGASGLRPREALSLDHWLDLLSLHSSSKQSFFCRWRLDFRQFPAPTTPLKREATNAWAEWRVLQGATQGQTQVHAWSPVTAVEETITKSSRSSSRATPGAMGEESSELIELETVWSHPIDLHLAMVEPSALPASWPYLAFQLWSVNEFHHEHLVGAASLAIPLAQHEFFVDLPLTKLSRPSVLSSLGLVDEPCIDLEEEKEDANTIHFDNDDDDDGVVSSSVGTLFVRLAVVPQGFNERGVLS